MTGRLGSVPAVILVFAAGLSGCAEKDQQPMESGQVQWVRLCLPHQDGWLPLEAEIAATAKARARGLTGRERLNRREGMLFLYPQKQGPENRFWMYRTRIPLTIAFLGADGEVRSLRAMTPCAAEEPGECPYYEAGRQHQAALEVNQGLFRALGVEAGDRVMLTASADSGCELRKPFSPGALPEHH